MTKLKRSHERHALSETSHDIKGFGEIHFYLDGAAGVAQRRSSLPARLIAGIPSLNIVTKTRSPMELSKAVLYSTKIWCMSTYFS